MARGLYCPDFLEHGSTSPHAAVRVAPPTFVWSLAACSSDGKQCSRTQIQAPLHPALKDSPSWAGRRRNPRKASAFWAIVAEVAVKIRLGWTLVIDRKALLWGIISVSNNLLRKTHTMVNFSARTLCNYRKSKLFSVIISHLSANMTGRIVWYVS